MEFQDAVRISGPMELQTDVECPQGEGDTKIPTPMERHSDMECLQSSDGINISPPWNFQLTWSVHKVNMTSKFPPPPNLIINSKSLFPNQLCLVVESRALVSES